MSVDRAELETALGHRFGDRELLETALTHASHAAEQRAGRGNERLELLGDAVIGLGVMQLLYRAHPDWDEGELTRARAALVNREALAERARRLGLGPHLILGRTERRSAGDQKARVLADCFEALLGALHLDAGYEVALAAVERLFGSALQETALPDPKTAYQEWAHQVHRETPVYVLIRDSGGEEDPERFAVEVRLQGSARGAGVGRTKRGAERKAAEDALARRPGPEA